MRCEKDEEGVNQMENYVIIYQGGKRIGFRAKDEEAALKYVSDYIAADEKVVLAIPREIGDCVLAICEYDWHPDGWQFCITKP